MLNLINYPKKVYPKCTQHDGRGRNVGQISCARFTPELVVSRHSLNAAIAIDSNSNTLETFAVQCATMIFGYGV